MTIVRLLNQLQETDIATSVCRKNIARVQQELDGDPLAAERVAIAARKTELDKLRHHLRETEAEVEDFTVRIQHHEEQLYSGRVSNPKELAALQKDIGLLQKNRAPHEEKALELLDAVEKTEAAIDDAEIALQRHSEEAERQRQKLEQQLAELKKELDSLGNLRAGYVAELPPPVLQQYDFLTKQKGRALAKLEQGVCRGCGIAVTTAWVHRARTGEIANCPSCGRILYLE